MLEPVDVEASRDKLRTHSCVNPFGPSVAAPYCSEGCITGTKSSIADLNDFLANEDTHDQPNVLIVVP